MNLKITCHHIDITPSIEEHIRNKFNKITNHFNNVIDVKFTLTVEKKNAYCRINNPFTKV